MFSISTGETSDQLKPTNLYKKEIQHSKIKDFLLCEVVMNFWLFFLLRHFHGRSNLPILTASLLRRTGGGVLVLGVELAPATELSTSVVLKNIGARLVGTVFPPFMTMVLSLRPGSLLERSRETFKSPEGEVRPSSVTSIFYVVTDSF